VECDSRDRCEIRFDGWATVLTDDVCVKGPSSKFDQSRDPLDPSEGSRDRNSTIDSSEIRCGKIARNARERGRGERLNYLFANSHSAR